MQNESELIAYATASPLDYLVQEFVSQPNEVGVFYYRYPDEASGHISGIVRKELLTVTGNGQLAIIELLMKDKRFILQLPAFKKLYGDALNQVLPDGETKELVPYGNHARGAKFLDDSHLADEVFTKSMDHICRQVEGLLLWAAGHTVQYLGRIAAG